MPAKYIKMHSKVGYTVVVESIEHIRGLKATYPENIFSGIPKETRIYEIENSQINVYNDKKKVHSFRCPEYAARYLIAADIALVAKKKNIDFKLIQLFKEGKEVKNGDIINLIPESNNQVMVERESELALFMSTVDTSEPPKQIAEGYILVTNHSSNSKKEV